MRTSILSGLHSYSLINRRTWRSSSILRFARYFNFANESITSKSVTAPRPSTRDVHGTTSTWTFGIVRVGSAQFKVSRDAGALRDHRGGESATPGLEKAGVPERATRHHERVGARDLERTAHVVWPEDVAVEHDGQRAGKGLTHNLKLVPLGPVTWPVVPPPRMDGECRHAA